MKQMLRRTIDRNREKVGAPTPLQWDEWLDHVYGSSG
jgi:hypothetical protein